MIARVRHRMRRARRKLSRSELEARLLSLSRSAGTEAEPGLIFVQIDGLSFRQIKHALKKKRMPFLRRLLRREDYRLHPMYTGMPSNTPSVQGEIFYGVRACVPAFGYRDMATGATRYMFLPESAGAVEARLKKEGKGLLADGSAYSNIFTGGAAESHFCAASMGWGRLRKYVNPFWLLLVFIMHLPVALRIGALMFVEFWLAVIDSIRGIAGRQPIWKEIEYVPGRVAVCVLLRELVTIGAKIDAARGLPIIHMNYVGYDEQSHRRGPSSAFAHWSLRGIDKCIQEVWRAGRRSGRREYEVWIYSDHGQEEALMYPVEYKADIHQVVSEVLCRHGDFEECGVRQVKEDSTRRVLWLGWRWLRWLSKRRRAPQDAFSRSVHAVGEVGHVYLPRKPDEAESDVLATALVKEAFVPMVLMADDTGARVWTPAGRFHLPEDVSAVIGKDHPFLSEVGKDLADLTHLPDAGTFVICGWRWTGRPVSFLPENGLHAGPGYDETRAFALLPSDAPVRLHKRDYLRPMDLRYAALRHLKRDTEDAEPASTRRSQPRDTVRVLTYNVHGCRGMDGRLSPERLARIIARHDPDIVALQELDVGRERSGGVDQARIIAHDLEMGFHFHPALFVEEEQYGDAILSRLPMHLVKAGALPGLPRREPRGALWVEIEFEGRRIQVVNAHLGLRPRERGMQVRALLGRDWLNHPHCHAPVIFCGDFNTGALSPLHRLITKRYADVLEAREGRVRGTFLGIWHIDHIFVSPEFKVLQVHVPTSQFTRIASDHLPLIADVRLG